MNSGVQTSTQTSGLLHTKYGKWLTATVLSVSYLSTLSVPSDV